MKLKKLLKLISQKEHLLVEQIVCLPQVCLLTYEYTILSVVAVGIQNIFLLIVRYIFSVSNRANCKCSKQKQKSGYTILNPLKLCYWKEFNICIICITSIILIGSIRCWQELTVTKHWKLIISVHLQHTSHPIETKEVDSVCTPCPAEESICSFKSGSPVCHGNDGPDLGASSIGKLSVSKPAASGSKVGTLASNSRPQGQNAVGLQSSDADHVSFSLILSSHAHEKQASTILSHCFCSY